MFLWESPGGSPRRGRRWRDQTSEQSSLDEPDHATAPGGPLDRPNETATQGGPLEKEAVRQRGMQDKRQASINQDTRSVAGQQPVAQEQFKSPQYPAQANTVAPTTPASIPPPELTSSQPGPPPQQPYGTQPGPSHPQQPYGTHPIPPQANIPPQVGAQPYTPQSYHPHYQPTPFASPALQNMPQSLPFQPQYQSPAGFHPPPQTPQQSFQVAQPSAHIPQPSSLERLEMTKLKAESEVQQNRLMECQVANEHQEQQKTRLEEEVKELVKRVQEMEGARQRKDLDAASKVSELEGKVRP